jgi:Tol biopolymer transport system component
MIVLLTAASISYSDTYEIIQITTNDYNDTYPQINAEGDVVWSGQTGSNIYDSVEIFYYDTSEKTISQITDDDYRDSNPQINANGVVVWSGEDADLNFEIFLYDGLTTTQLTYSDALDNFLPQINANGDLVWYRRSSSTQYVLLYDRSSGTESWNFLYGQSPQINTEGHVVWYNQTVAQGIYLYNGTEEIKLDTDTSYLGKSPQINANGDVVWYGNDGQGSEIFLYESSSETTIQLTNNNEFDTNPQINESGDVVWRRYDGQNYAIYLYNRSSKEIIQLTSNDYYDGHPQINANGEVSWIISLLDLL